MFPIYPCSGTSISTNIKVSFKLWQWWPPCGCNQLNSCSDPFRFSESISCRSDWISAALSSARMEALSQMLPTSPFIWGRCRSEAGNDYCTEYAPSTGDARAHMQSPAKIHRRLFASRSSTSAPACSPVTCSSATTRRRAAATCQTSRSSRPCSVRASRRLCSGLQAAVTTLTLAASRLGRCHRIPPACPRRGRPLCPLRLCGMADSTRRA